MDLVISAAFYSKNALNVLQYNFAHYFTYALYNHPFISSHSEVNNTGKKDLIPR